MIDFPATAQVVSFDLRSIAPFPQTVQIWHDGRVIDQRSTRGDEWFSLRYAPLRSVAGKRFRRFEIRVEPTWTPPGDPRELGVMVSNVTWSP
jgi:hypothetical protein